ncbi:hypothetical protein IJV79_03330 [bacterium]|nr:hypothetical protein [bacterium]
MLKKLVSSLILFCFSANLVFAGDVFSGYIEKTTEPQYNSELYTGEIQIIEKESTVKMTVSDVIDGSFAIEGDEFFAEITDDVTSENGILIPAGSIAHGRINEAVSARRLGRNGWVDLTFDYIVTPDGNNIPIEGRISTKDHPLVETGKIIATDVGYTAAGGVVGGIFALQLFGLEAAIASQGYTVAGGAAIGGVIGLGASLYRKGKTVMIKPGDEIKVKVTSSVPLPVYKNTAFLQEEVLYEGLDVKISDIKYEEDPFGQLNTITLIMSVTNRTPLTFSSFDVCLENDYNAKFHPSVFGKSNLLFKHLKTGDSASGEMSFTVDNIKRKYWLVFYDRITRKPVARISVNNAYRGVSDKRKKKNNKKFEKKKYYKNENLEFDL